MNTYQNSLLALEVTENDDFIQVVWKGRSIERDPGEFITPLLVRIVKRSSDTAKRIIFDFTEIEYMNSSTITPIVKVLERARRGSTRITVHYALNMKWQELIFVALKIFTTKNNRVVIEGK